MLEGAGYVVPTKYSQGTAKTISKEKMVDILGGEILLAQLDHQGNELETWTIKNPLITSVEFDTVDYSSDEMLNITITLKYDFATLKQIAPLAADSDRTSTQLKVTQNGRDASAIWDYNTLSSEGTLGAPAGTYTTDDSPNEGG